MRRRGMLALALVAVAALMPAPARSLPISPPTIELTVTPTNDPFSFDLKAIGRDPDGPVFEIEVCGEGPASGACVAALYAAGPLDPVLDCLNGDEEQLELPMDFGGYGVMRASALVLASGCPVLGANEAAFTAQMFPIPPPVQPVACAIPGTPGSSDVGVEPDRVRLGATVPVSGPWSNLAAPALKSMQAAIQRINTSGGVCGRALELVWFDDGSDPAKAPAEIRRLVEEDRVFALVGMPSPGTLTSSLSYLEAAGVPVVGTTGADADEFASPIVWPVGPSHESFAEVVVADAYAAGARRFAVVWQDQPFGTEIRDAVAAVVSSQPDATIAAEARVSPTEPSMGPPITRMRQMCGAGGCDAVVYMLDPTNMAKWFQTEANVNGAVRGRLTTILPPHLVLRLVGGGCHIECEGLRGWAGFDLPVGGAGPAAARYLDDIRSLSGAPPDASNPFVESVYAAVVLAAEAMARTGTNLTRAGLSALLDTASFDLGLARSPLSWASSREANRSLRAYRPDATGPAFTSWVRDTDWITSP